MNERYAAAAADAAAPGASVWVHDYHLQLVPKMLRELRPDVRIGFFLHIPFPPQELFVQLPWRREILEGILGADLVGLQVSGGASNFARLARRLVGATGSGGRVEFDGRSIEVRRVPDLGRRRTTSSPARTMRRSARERARSAPSSAIPRSSSSASTASTTPRASINACARSASCSPTGRSSRRGT